MNILNFIRDAFLFVAQMFFDFVMVLLGLAIVVAAFLMVTYIIKVIIEELRNGKGL